MMGILKGKDDKLNTDTQDENGHMSGAGEEEYPVEDNTAGTSTTAGSENLWFGDEVERNRRGIRAEMGQAISSYKYETDGYKGAKLVGMYSETRVPHIVYVCREAREVFLQHYTPAFHCTGSIPQTYFDFSIDTLYFRYDRFSYYFSKGGLDSISLDLEYRSRIEDTENLRKVQRLAILLDSRASGPPEVDLASIFGIFGGIKEFTIVLRHFIDKDTFKNHIEDSQDPVEQSQLVMIEPIDVGRALAGFYTSRPPNPSWRIPRRVRDFPRVDSIRLDTQKLEECQAADCKEGEFPWEMPHIDKKVVAPLRLKRELRAAKSVARR